MVLCREPGIHCLHSTDDITCMLVERQRCVHERVTSGDLR